MWRHLSHHCQPPTRCYLSPNLIGSHASLPKNSDVALSVIPEDYIELLRCSGERHRALLLHSRANVRDIHRLRDVLTDLVEDRLRNRPWQYWNGRSRTGISCEDHACLRQSVCLPDMATCSSRS